MTNESVTLDDAFFATPEERREDPYPYYERLRALPQGVGRSATFGTWHTATHAHVKALLVDPRLSTNPKFASGSAASGAPAQLSPARAQENVLLFMDPPDHTRIRRLASKAFTPRAVRRPRGRHRADRARELLDEIGVGPGSGPFDLVSGYARLLPLAVICRMFAIPDIDRTNFLRWSDDLAHALEPIETPEAIETTIRSYLEFAQYFTDLAAERRTNLGDDLFSALLAAEADGDRLSAEELQSLFTLLFIAGHETTGNLIGNGTLALLRNPDQLAASAPTPAPSQRPSTSCSASTPRCSSRAASRRSPSRSRAPTCVSTRGTRSSATSAAPTVTRPSSGPTPTSSTSCRDARNHLAFGGGIHYCMGASLARLEATVAFRVLLERCPDLELAEDDPPHRDQVVLRGLERLAVGVRLRPSAQGASSADTKSAITSSTCSSPIDTRIVPAEMPLAASSSGVRLTCVVEAGWVTRVSGPASDGAMRATWSDSTKRRPPSNPSVTSKEIIAPIRSSCATASSCCGWEASPG